MTADNVKTFTASGDNISGDHHVRRNGSIEITGMADRAIRAYKNGEDKTQKLIGASSISVGSTHTVESDAPTGTYLLAMATEAATGTSGTLHVGSGDDNGDDDDDRDGGTP